MPYKFKWTELWDGAAFIIVFTFPECIKNILSSLSLFEKKEAHLTFKCCSYIFKFLHPHNLVLHEGNQGATNDDFLSTVCI